MTSRIDDLLTLAHAYGEGLGIGLSTVSWRSLGDTKKLAAIEAGRDIQVRRCDRAIMWFSENWPDAVDWPTGVDRPRSVQVAS